MNVLRAAVIAALFSMANPGVGKADDVTLSSRDGSIELSGDLLGYDGEYYRIETEYGILTVDGSAVVCDGPGCPSLGNYVADITLSGAREMGSVLIPALVEGFALRRGYALAREEVPGQGLKYTLYEGGEDGIRTAEFTIRQTSNAEGFADLLGQQSDIALAMREVTRTERRMGQEAGLGDLQNARQARVLALDALVPVVSPGNPVRRLTMEQLVDIYAGRISNWSEVGGEDAPITAYLLRDAEGFSDVFDRRVMAGVKLSEDVLRQPSNSDLIHAISEDPFGIGISTFSQPGNTEIVTLSGACGYELAANPQSIRGEDYPLTAPLFVYLPARRLPKIARDFLAYIRSDAAQLVIRRVGLVDQVPGESPVDVQGRRLANAIESAGPEIDLDELKAIAALMVDTARLSVTFRFRGGSSDLDAPSLSNILLLAQALESGRFDGRTLQFVGFTDGLGTAARNQQLALRRAQAVMRAVESEAETLDDRVAFAAVAFGEALPMACDDSAWGRRVNRRVEVWVK